METCQICQQSFEDKCKLSKHLQFSHKISTKDYTVQYLHNGIQPMCQECGKKTRYVSFRFKFYCKEHSCVAESEGGKVGGKLWQETQTRNTNKKHKQEILQKQRIPDSRIIEVIQNLSGDFDIALASEGYVKRDLYNFQVKCKTCSNEFMKSFNKLEKGIMCPKCFPPNTHSRPQLELFEFVKSLSPDAINNDKSLIKPKELDTLCPSSNLAIEYHGLRWHSEEFAGKTKHYEKYLLYKEKSVGLIQIFNDEWFSKKEIIKSIISHKLGKTSTRIFARKCEVVELSDKQTVDFLNQNHISGHSKAQTCFGLKFNNELVAVLTARTPFHKRWLHCTELCRFKSLSEAPANLVKPRFPVWRSLSLTRQTTPPPSFLWAFGVQETICS